jgi:hypothetical protein
VICTPIKIGLCEKQEHYLFHGLSGSNTIVDVSVSVKVNAYLDRVGLRRCVTRTQD